MFKDQTPGVQAQAVQIPTLPKFSIYFPVTVTYVAHQGMEEMFEVTANLVKTPRVDPDLDQAAAGLRAVGDLTQGGHGRDARPLFNAWNRVVDHRELRRAAPHQGQIALIDTTAGPLLLKGARVLLIEREEQKTRARAIEAVNRMHEVAAAAVRADHRGVTLSGPAPVNR